MFMLLVTRLLFSKKERGPDTLLDRGYVWYDNNNPTAGSNYDFMNYTSFNTSVDWFEYCTDRDDGPDRTIIALAPSGNALVADIKASLDAQFAATDLTVQLYESRDAIMDIIGASNYEKDDSTGI
jgi:hypothetical protein